MNGIIHLIAFDRSEYWIDGEPVDSIFLEGFNNPARFGRGATITYKNGEERIFEEVLHVEIMPTDCKGKSAPVEDKKEDTEEDTDKLYLHHDVYDICGYLNDMDIKEREEKRKTAKYPRRVRRSGYFDKLISFCNCYGVNTVGDLLKTGPEVLNHYLESRVFDLIVEAFKKLYNINYMKFHHERNNLLG